MNALVRTIVDITGYDLNKDKGLNTDGDCLGEGVIIPVDSTCMLTRSIVMVEDGNGNKSAYEKVIIGDKIDNGEVPLRLVLIPSKNLGLRDIKKMGVEKTCEYIRDKVVEQAA